MSELDSVRVFDNNTYNLARVQERLRVFGKPLALVAGNYAERGIVEASRLALRTSLLLLSAGITHNERKGRDNLVVIRPVIVAPQDQIVEEGAHLLRTHIAARDVPVYLIPEPIPIEAEDDSSEPLTEQIPRAIDTAIVDLGQKTIQTHLGETTLDYHPDVALVLVTRHSVIGHPILSPTRLSADVGDVAVLAKVGKTPQENVWHLAAY